MAGKPVRSNHIADAEITVTQGAAGAFTCAVQLLGPNGEALTASAGVFAYISKNSDGSTIATDQTDISSLAAGTDGLMVEAAGSSTAVSGHFISESDGDIDIVVTVLSGKTAYLVLVMPDGSLVISDAMTYSG